MIFIANVGQKSKKKKEAFFPKVRGNMSAFI